MADPPRDQDGVIEPHDDEVTIPDDSDVVRYIAGRWLTENHNPADTRRLSKGAFSASSKERDRYEGMSVDMYDKMVRDGVDPTSRMRPEHQGAVLLRVGELRKLGFRVGPDPMENDDPYHAAVWDVQDRHRKAIRKLARWLIKPDDVEDDLPEHDTP